MDVLLKNVVKAKHEDKHTLEQSILYVIKNAKDTKYAKETLCTVFSQLSSRLINKYVPHKLFLRYIKKCNINVYNFYAKQILLKKQKLGGTVTVTETPSFTVVKLFDRLTVFKNYKGAKPIATDNNAVEFLPGHPKVSIIVPVHNVEKYVGECMGSLINQTMQDIEIICIDDCGKDNSMQIVEQFAQRDKRIKIIKNNKNRGLSYSRNAGIKNATAPYIMFCDSDDMLALDTCEKMLAIIAQQNADIAACSMKIIYETNQELRDSDNYLKVKQDGTFDMNKQVQVSCNVCGPAKLYKRKILQEHNIEFPVGLRHEDEFFYPAYCIWAKRIAFTSEELYQYRRRTNSIMNSVYRRETLNIDPIKVTMQYMKYCKKHGVWEREKLWFWDVMFPGMFSASLRHSG
jgi:glycosyltransferase involved in cell wall biosynthesis